VAVGRESVGVIIAVHGGLRHAAGQVPALVACYIVGFFKQKTAYEI